MIIFYILAAIVLFIVFIFVLYKIFYWLAGIIDEVLKQSKELLELE